MRTLLRDAGIGKRAVFGRFRQRRNSLAWLATAEAASRCEWQPTDRITARISQLPSRRVHNVIVVLRFHRGKCEQRPQQKSNNNNNYNNNNNNNI